MRWTCRIVAALAVGTLAGSAAGFEPGCTSCGDAAYYGTYCAPACACPAFGMVPGCCECQPSGCDNAWAGYCVERALKEKAWYLLGTNSLWYQKTMMLEQAAQGAGLPVVLDPVSYASPGYVGAAPPPLPAVPAQLYGPEEPDGPALPAPPALPAEIVVPPPPPPAPEPASRSAALRRLPRT